MKRDLQKYILVFFTGFTLLACGSGHPVTEEADDEEIVTTLDSHNISAQNVFNTLPSREKVVNLILQSQSEYNPQNLNDPDKVNIYSVESSKALNLGVYGTDLNSTGVFEQTQESFLFLKCVNILAKSLGVNNAFDERMVDRITANKSNRDSTLEIISQSFKNADAYLRENNRPATSSLIVAGAWVEGMFLASKIAVDTKDKLVIKEIINQKESLKYLIQLLQQSKLPDDCQYLLPELLALKNLMNEKKESSYTTATISDISPKISSIRNKITSGK